MVKLQKKDPFYYKRDQPKGGSVNRQGVQEFYVYHVSRMRKDWRGWLELQ
jgi:hypothetical protein